MLDLKRFDKDGLELFINLGTGECFANQNSLVRMTGVAKSTMSDWCKGVRQTDVITSEVLTNGGIQGVRLYKESVILQCFAKYKPEFILKFAQAGLRVYLHRLASCVIIILNIK